MTKSASLDRRDALVAGLLAAAALVVYVVTLAPGLLESDSAELQTQAARLGFAHPTGYPVYLLLAHAATWLPVGDVAYRVNLFSAIAAALAVAEVYLVARLLTDARRGQSHFRGSLAEDDRHASAVAKIGTVPSRVPAAVAAVALAVSPTFWSQAIVAKVYTTGLAAMLAVILCLELWRRSDRWGWLLAAGSIGGLSIGIHITHSLMAPAAVLLVALAWRRWKVNWPVAVGGAILGLAVTLAAYAVLHASNSPTCYFKTVIAPSRSLWDLSPEQTEGYWSQVRLCLCPPQYTGLILSRPWSEFCEKAAWYFGNLPYEFPWPWLLAAAAGVVWLAPRNPRITLLLVLTFGAHLGYDLVYDMGGIHVLYLATYVPIVLFGAAGLAWAREGLLVLTVGRVFQPVHEEVGTESGRVGKPVLRRDRPALLIESATLLLGLAVVGYPMLWPAAWNVEGRREARVPPGEDAFRVLWAPTCEEPIADYRQRIGEMVDDLEPGALVFTGWCHLYPYYYVAHLERGRGDLVFLQDYPHPYHFELADSALDYVAEIAQHRAVYFTHEMDRVKKRFEIARVVRGRETFYRVVGRKGDRSVFSDQHP